MLANFLSRLFATLSLPWNHRLGTLLGWTVYLLSPRYRNRLRENLSQSGLFDDPQSYRRLLHSSVAEAGKAFTEVLIAWLRPEAEVIGLVRRCEGWEHVEAARAQGKGIIFVTPHLGSFDIAGRYLASRLPVTFLYRPPKLAWAADMMNAGRERGQARMASADMLGVRALLRTLKQHGNVAILPDQAPGAGDGVWADFFGRPAYTMTLVARLQHITGAPIVLFYGQRLPGCQGYALHLEPLAALSSDKHAAASDLNAAVERLIAHCPAQYLWSYNRYKTPSGAQPPGSARNTTS